MGIKSGLGSMTIACVLLSLVACSIGPATVARDRFDYASAISEYTPISLLSSILSKRT